MKAKFLFPFLALLFLLSMFIYFLVNPSYQKSLEAKFFFELGNYQKAYTLANEAFSLDVYNKMAATVMAQSKTSLKYKNYIEEAKRYLQEINEIVQQESISSAQRAKIRTMSKIMVDSYKKLAPSVVTDKELIVQAQRYYENFEKLLEKIGR
jgi:tetratricopeptide (TPR) repeat protein